jgi:hypothetical protein
MHCGAEVTESSTNKQHHLSCTTHTHTPNPHRPRLVVSHSTCPPLSSSPHAHSFVIGPAVIKHTHGEFLRLLFLQVHRETEAHFTATSGMPSQRNQSESFRFKRAAFYQGLKSKVGLAAAKAAALRINLNVHVCSIVAAPMHAPSRTSLLLPLLLSHNLYQSPSPPRSLVRDEQTSPP